MNWNTLKQKATDTLAKIDQKIDPYVKKAEPYVDKLKTARRNSLEFMAKQVQGAPITLKNRADFDTLAANVKRLLVIAYDESSADGQDLFIKFPKWMTAAWKDNATLRFVSVSTSPELARDLDLTSPVSMQVYWNAEKKFTLTDRKSIEAWWSSPNYDGSVSGSDAHSADPLAKI